MSNRKQKAIMHPGEDFIVEFNKLLIVHKKVKVAGLGIFYTKNIKLRKGVHPRTLKPMNIKSHTRLKFSPCISLKRRINK